MITQRLSLCPVRKPIRECLYVTKTCCAKSEILATKLIAHNILATIWKYNNTIHHLNHLLIFSFGQMRSEKENVKITLYREGEKQNVKLYTNSNGRIKCSV